MKSKNNNSKIKTNNLKVPNETSQVTLLNKSYQKRNFINSKQNR